MPEERWPLIILRVLGVNSLFAVLFVAAPREWMRQIHEQLGMGTLPDAPVVWYLARSTSAFYAILGGLFLVLASDLDRHRRVITYIGVAITLFGLALGFIDHLERLPRLWAVWEGPFVALCGVAILLLNRQGRRER